MILDSVPPNATLSSMLHARAVAATPRRLYLDIAGGSAVVVAAALTQPYGWITMACAGLCFASYGIWALCERRMETGATPLEHSEEVALGAVRFVVSITGFAAFLVMAFSFTSVLLGHWIS